MLMVVKGGLNMGKLYAFIDNGRVREIIKSEGVFENIPLERRYPKEIVDKCVEIDDSVKEGMDYNSETGEFTEHIEPEIVEVIEEEVINEEVIEEEMGNNEVVEEEVGNVEVVEEETENTEVVEEETENGEGVQE